MDSSFLQFAELFVEDVKDLTANARKVVLAYDGCRSHLGWKVLRVLEQWGIIAVALPANASGRTQPLDLSVFPTFKQKLNDTIHQV